MLTGSIIAAAAGGAYAYSLANPDKDLAVDFNQRFDLVDTEFLSVKGEISPEIHLKNGKMDLGVRRVGVGASGNFRDHTYDASLRHQLDDTTIHNGKVTNDNTELNLRYGYRSHSVTLDNRYTYATAQLDTQVGYQRNFVHSASLDSYVRPYAQFTNGSPTNAGGVGIAGVGIYQVWRASQTAGAVGASLTASSASGVGQWIGEALRGSVIGGLKVAAISGAAGLGIMGAYGAVKGALEARTGNQDLSSIASVTEEGSAPSNGGPALSWAQLYPNGAPVSSSVPSESTYTPPSAPGYGNPTYGVPSYGSPIFFQQPRAQQAQPAATGLMSPQQLRGLATTAR